MSKICRICLESVDVDKMISPCSCKGSSLLIHINCLDAWQTLSIRRENFQSAFYCTTCKSRYRYPSLFFQTLRILFYYFYSRAENSIIRLFDLVWSTMVLIKLYIYLILSVLLIIVNYQLKIFGNYALAALKDNGTLQLAVIHSSNTNQQKNSRESVYPGCILVPLDKIPNNCIFKTTQILVFEHTPRRTRGLALSESASNRSRHPEVLVESYLFGGPVDEKEKLFVICDRLIFDTFPRPLAVHEINLNNIRAPMYVYEFRRRVPSKPIGINVWRTYQGCAKWLPGQLEGEILAELWHKNIAIDEHFLNS